MSYKLVPLEPTPEMEAAYKNGDGTHVGLYRAMVEAAPAAPVELEPVGYFYIDERGFWEQAGDPRGFPSMTPLYGMPPDAAAVIAAKDAEIERLKEERLGVISQSNMHPSWLEKSREEILDCLRFQGRTTALLLAETADLRKQLSAAEKQRDELMEALDYANSIIGFVAKEWHESVEAVISKVKGEKE